MSISRRDFLGAAGATIGAAAVSSLDLASAQSKKIPVGLELYSVRQSMSMDAMGTLKKVADMGYKNVEIFATANAGPIPATGYIPYCGNIGVDKAKEVRKLLNDTGMTCLSTHNHLDYFNAEKIGTAIEINKILGTRYMVLSSSLQGAAAQSIDGWKKLAETITAYCETLRKAGLRGGYHNHQTEFTKMEFGRPIEVIAANTPKDFMLQLDCGTCVEVGSDPVAWINANPGRINSVHLKEWNKANGYKTLLAEGDCPWKAIYDAAEKVGGVEYYLIEQEGTGGRLTEAEAAKQCLDIYKKMQG